MVVASQGLGGEVRALPRPAWSKRPGGHRLLPARAPGGSRLRGRRCLLGVSTSPETHSNPDSQRFSLPRIRIPLNPDYCGRAKNRNITSNTRPEARGAPTE